MYKTLVYQENSENLRDIDHLTETTRRSSNYLLKGLLPSPWRRHSDVIMCFSIYPLYLLSIGISIKISDTRLSTWGMCMYVRVYHRKIPPGMLTFTTISTCLMFLILENFTVIDCWNNFWNFKTRSKFSATKGERNNFIHYTYTVFRYLNIIIFLVRILIILFN